MKKANRFLQIGSIGLGISLALGILLDFYGSFSTFIPFVIPWIAFIIIGLAKHKQPTAHE